MTPRHALQPMYRPAENGVVTVYTGGLYLSKDGVTHEVSGALELRLNSRATLSARFASEQDIWLDDGDWQVQLPPGVSLEPPASLTVPAQPANAVFWGSANISELIIGEVNRAEHLLVHVSGPVTNHPLPQPHPEVGRQLSFSLPGWDLRMAAVEPRPGIQDFSFVIDAVPQPAGKINEDAVKRLRRKLFLLFSLTAGQQIGVGPMIGLDDNDLIAWANWGISRFDGFERQPGWRWCPTPMVANALPMLAQGFCTLTHDPALDVIVDRAINYLLVANGPGALDVRIPVACSGLELLGWAVLQREQWLTTEAMKSLLRSNTSAVIRLLCKWAGVPIDLPDHFTELDRRRSAIGQRDWTGPDVLFSVRNDLVHPPKKLAKPEWPNAELFETWLLATWYLELAILRLLGYDHYYKSRLEAGRESAGSIVWMPWHNTTSD